MDHRQQVWEYAQRMWELGLVSGSSGNVSARIDDERIAITPSGVPYDGMDERDIVIVPGEGKPSYELPLHLEIYKARPDVHAIIHTHAPFVTTLSVLRRSLPILIDEMYAYFGGRTIAVAEYGITGTEKLGRYAAKALGDGYGVLLANHGNVCVADNLAQALKRAIAMEEAARVYVQALQIGKPVPLPDAAFAAVHERES